jgi:mannose-1-phosphate guanylyltransferase
MGGRWAIVLAGGEGTRVHGLTFDELGRPAPKQYSRIAGQRSLLTAAIARAERLAPRGQIVVVVAGGHERWWRSIKASHPEVHLVIQTLNRGTAPAILDAILHIQEHDPNPHVAILPADHAVENEAVLAATFRSAFHLTASDRHSILMLGIEPDRAEQGYGWVEPLFPPNEGPSPVAYFVEKPPASLAAELMERGALWNAFLLVGAGRCFLDLYRIAQSDLLHDFTNARGEAADIVQLYRRLPVLDFSRDVLALIPGRLRVMRVPPCGWTDLGTPERLARWSAAHAVEPCARGIALPAPLRSSVSDQELIETLAVC